MFFLSFWYKRASMAKQAQLTSPSDVRARRVEDGDIRHQRRLLGSPTLAKQRRPRGTEAKARLQTWTLPPRLRKQPLISFLFLAYWQAVARPITTPLLSDSWMDEIGHWTEIKWIGLFCYPALEKSKDMYRREKCSEMQNPLYNKNVLRQRLFNNDYISNSMLK
jgi:hypothetical protein